uniref:Uncharacterized protein n=1 Tax=Arundo donax TaxID=35708 RepID=A0A0A9ACW2_ARUDO
MQARSGKSKVRPPFLPNVVHRMVTSMPHFLSQQELGSSTTTKCCSVLPQHLLIQLPRQAGSEKRLFLGVVTPQSMPCH